jgi:phosphoribosylpyrophosphate synthetase
MCAVIFDHTTLFRVAPAHVAELRTLLGVLGERGVKTAVFSTDRINIDAQLAANGYPPVDLYLCSDDVGGQKKGTRAWVTCASERLGVANNRMAYVGDDQQDWREAVNTGTFPLHALWAKQEHEKRPISVRTPRRLQQFLTHFILPRARWQNTLDQPERGITYRGLMHPDSTLQNDAGGTFNLKDVFTYKNTYQVNGFTSHSYLLLHCLSNLYAEGRVPSGCWFTYYPGHLAGATSAMFQQFLQPASTFFHGFFHPRLLVRWRDALDSSKEKAAGRKVPFSEQARTVKVNDDYRGRLAGKTVVVFDDFSTTGGSLDWARTLLLAAGAERVIGMTVGKYPGPYNHHRPNFAVNPFGESDHTDADFTVEQFSVTNNASGRATTEAMNRRWVVGEDYPA